jgi:hypothetical protein
MRHLHLILLGLRPAPSEDSGILAAELVFSEPLQRPGQFLTTDEPPSFYGAAEFYNSLGGALAAFYHFSLNCWQLTRCTSGCRKRRQI